MFTFDVGIEIVSMIRNSPSRKRHLQIKCYPASCHPWRIVFRRGPISFPKVNESTALIDLLTCVFVLSPLLLSRLPPRHRMHPHPAYTLYVFGCKTVIIYLCIHYASKSTCLHRVCLAFIAMWSPFSAVEALQHRTKCRRLIV